MTTASPTIAPGTVIDGIYTVHESLRTRLGAETFAATDPDGGSVAVTAYRPESFANPESEEQALQELRALSSVTDPRIVRVLGSGRLDDGGIYEVHERIEGEFISTAGKSPDALKELETILGALHQAIEVGVVHHNLGPDAVVRTADGLKVGWFAVGEPQGGVSFGAIECIAPEQVEGKGVTESTLVYNLAALGQRLRSGEPLFSGDVATLLLQHAASTPPPSVHPALSKALAKDPKARPSLADFAASLATIDAPEENIPIPRAPSGLPGFGRLGPSPGAKLAPPPGGSLAPPPTLGGLGASQSRPIFGAPGEKSAPVAAATPPAESASPVAPPVTAPLSAPPLSAPPLGAPKLGGAPSLGGSVSPGTAGAAKKPRTRGWTMFMEATEDEPAPSTVPVASPPVAAPPLAAPVAAPVAAPPVGAPVAAPPVGAPAMAPTFAAAGGTATPTIGTPAAPIAPPLGGAPSAAPPAAAAPSTRGWTMIMDDPEEAEAATPAVPAAAPVPAAPSTRGWTMLEELNESPEVDSELGSGELDPEPGATGAPTSRGWTMFMEAELEGEAAAEAAPEPEPDPGFYEGPMTTDAGTVVAAAPLAPSAPVRAPASPSAPVVPVAPRPTPSAPETEPMTSFAAKLRGPESEPKPEPAPTPLETTAESLAALAEEATASTAAPASVSPVMPSFSGGGSSFDLKPTTAPSPAPVPTEYEDEDEPKQGRVGSAVAIVVMLALVAFLVYYFFFS